MNSSSLIGGNPVMQGHMKRATCMLMIWKNLVLNYP